MLKYNPNDFKIENDLKKVYELVKTKYKNVPFDKALPPIREEMWKLADKYNTTGAEMWKLFFDMTSSLLKENAQ